MAIEEVDGVEAPDDVPVSCGFPLNIGQDLLAVIGEEFFFFVADDGAGGALEHDTESIRRAKSSIGFFIFFIKSNLISAEKYAKAEKKRKSYTLEKTLSSCIFCFVACSVQVRCGVNKHRGKMQTNCPHCNKSNSFENQQEGAMVTCPECRNIFVLKDEGVIPAVCPDCKSSVPAGDRICLNCGFNFDTGKKVEEHIAVYGEDFSWPRKALDAVVDFIPGLFKIHIVLLFCASIVVAVFLIYFGLILMALGALVTLILMSVCALIVYAHGVGFMLTGEVQTLNSAMAELTGGRWTFFLVLVFGVPITIFLIIFKIGLMLAK